MITEMKSYKSLKGVFRISFPVRIFSCGDDYPAQVLCRLFFDESMDAKMSADASIEFTCQRDLKDEEYKISVTENKILVGYNSRLAARNAAVTLFSLIKNDGECYFIDCCEIFDYPDSGYRGLMLDPARGKISLPEVKNYIKFMALAKLNVLHLHLLDSRHYCLQSDAYPELNNNGKEYYTYDEMREILSCAEFYSIEAIPEIEMPAHAWNLVGSIGELRCDTGEKPVSEWVVCVGNQKTLEVLTGLLDEIISLFPSKYVHIGTDELEFLDLDDKRWVSWEDCRRCTSVMEKEKLAGKRELFYWFVSRIHEYIRQRGRTMIMWNDSIDISVSPPISRDILIEYWRVAETGRGPVAGCSLRRFLEEGFKVINADYLNTYIDLYIKEERLVKWMPYSTPLSTTRREYESEITKTPLITEYKDRILGGEMCAWEGKKHFPRNLPQVIIMFGSRLWCFAEQTINSDYRTGLTRAVLGPKIHAGFDVFYALGGCILPYDDNVPAVVSEGVTPQELDRAIQTLSGLADKKIFAQSLANEYIRCLEWLKTQPSKE